MSSIAQHIRERVWTRQGLTGWAGWLALQPVSGLFATGVALRNLGYRMGVLRVHRAGIAVISVGNLSVGGTGKTPVTLWLARQLSAPRVRVAILLRGYRGHARGVTIVSRGNGPEVDVARSGDEAMMLAKCFGGCVLTARRRVEGVAAAEQLGCRIVILDDGFQHRPLARDFDLVLVSGRRSGLLPAGPMRERWAALARADAVAVVAKSDDDPVALPAFEAVPPMPTFVVRFIPTALVESDAGRWRELPIGMLSGARVAIVSGIAQPAPFYATVRQWEAQIDEIFEYPDHHHYTLSDWQNISRATRDVDLIVTTEKDLVKLEHFPFAKGKLVALRITPDVAGGGTLLRMIKERARLAQVLSPEEESDAHQ